LTELSNGHGNGCCGGGEAAVPPANGNGHANGRLPLYLTPNGTYS
jgi:hypothetical protein